MARKSSIENIFEKLKWLTKKFCHVLMLKHLTSGFAVCSATNPLVDGDSCSRRAILPNKFDGGLPVADRSSKWFERHHPGINCYTARNMAVSAQVRVSDQSCCCSSSVTRPHGSLHAARSNLVAFLSQWLKMLWMSGLQLFLAGAFPNVPTFVVGVIPVLAGVALISWTVRLIVSETRKHYSKRKCNDRESEAICSRVRHNYQEYQ